MSHRTSMSSPICIKTIASSLSLLTMACALAQVPRPDAASSPTALAQPVPLVSGSCASVRPGAAISLEWNPTFEPFWAVTGLKSFRLIFHSLLADGVTPNPVSRLIVDSNPGGKATALGDGSFRIEARLPLASHPGTYHLVAAHSSPQILPDYQGEAPEMTVSPVSEDLCITVAPSTQAASSSPPE